MLREPDGHAAGRRLRPPSRGAESPGSSRVHLPVIEATVSIAAIRKELHRVADAASRPAALQWLADPDLRLILATLTELLQGQREFQDKYGTELRTLFKRLAYAIRDTGSEPAATRRGTRRK
jgi:hypothetical protein